jgi:cyclase
MFRPRIIPVLLLHKDHLVKSRQFKHYKYIGDPINAVRIFNEFKADELVFLDVSATKDDRSISVELIKNIGEEANMPFGVGGGIDSVAKIQELIAAGAEKVIIGSHAVADPTFVRSAADAFGSSTITVCIDVKKNIWGKERVWSVNGSKASGIDPLEFAQMMEQMGAGEIIIQSIAHDGEM